MEHRGIIKSIRGYKQDFKKWISIKYSFELVGKLDDSGKLLNTDSGFNNVATKLDVVDLTVANDLI
jgi:hypothetical protein